MGSEKTRTLHKHANVWSFSPTFTSHMHTTHTHTQAGAAAIQADGEAIASMSGHTVVVYTRQQRGEQEGFHSGLERQRKESGDVGAGAGGRRSQGGVGKGGGKMGKSMKGGGKTGGGEVSSAGKVVAGKNKGKGSAKAELRGDAGGEGVGSNEGGKKVVSSRRRTEGEGSGRRVRERAGAVDEGAVDAGLV